MCACQNSKMCVGSPKKQPDKHSYALHSCFLLCEKITKSKPREEALIQILNKYLFFFKIVKNAIVRSFLITYLSVVPLLLLVVIYFHS